MPLTIDLPPDVLAALRGRAAARGRTPEEEARVALAASVDVLFNPPAPQAGDGRGGGPDGDRRTDPGAVAPAGRLRADVKQPPVPTAEQAEALAEFLASDLGVEDAEMSDAEWRAYWETLERDGEGRPEIDQSGRGDRPVRTDRAAA